MVIGCIKVIHVVEEMREAEAEQGSKLGPPELCETAVCITEVRIPALAWTFLFVMVTETGVKS